jgi:hypothetical protein
MLQRRVHSSWPVIFFGIWLAFYPVSGLGESFIEPVAQYLYDSTFVNINSNYTADIRYNQKILFNKQVTDKYSNIIIQVNKNIELDDISIITFLPDGRSVELAKDEIQTISDFGTQFYPESKTKIILVPLARELAQAKISYKIRYSNLLYLPQFFRQREIPTANSYLAVRSEIPFRFYASPGQFQLIDSGGVLELWSSEIPAYPLEGNSQASDAYRIMIRPDRFAYDDREYKIGDWADVGRFYNLLSNPNWPQNSRVVKLADSLCLKAVARTDSLKALYDFVRENVRYISADFGRGDFQPAAPEEILNRKYGDCKDQSALLVALYRSVGFSAYSGLLATNDKQAIIDTLPWPSVFNHVIVVVESRGDRFFLDPSQASCCFGKLPWLCRNRPILICRENGEADLVLPSISDEGNAVDISLIYRVNSSGDIHCQTRLALYRDMAFAYYDDSSQKVLAELKKSLLVNLPADQYQRTFRLEKQAPDVIIVSGSFIDKLQPIAKESSPTQDFLIKLFSPSLDYFKSIFDNVNRLTTYNFLCPFRLKETIDLTLPDDFQLWQDSLSLDYNEPELQYHFQLYSAGKVCRTYKYFQLAQYSLAAQKYNLFSSFLLKTLQTVPHPMEIVPVPHHEE